MLLVLHGEGEGESVAPVPVLHYYLSLYSYLGDNVIIPCQFILSTVGASTPAQGLTKEPLSLPFCTMHIEIISGVAHERGTSLNVLLGGPNFLDADLTIIFAVKV